MTITVIDSGGANLSSVLFALERLGAKATLTADREVIRSSPKLILPGVGAAGAVMRNLENKGLLPTLRALRQPVLGICLGMQIMFERSEEGDVECLGVIPGTVTRIPARPDHPVPHMGWNRVEAVAECPLIGGSSDYFYFVHSYMAPRGAAVRGVADYGGPIPAVVQKDNWLGVQFHPERSGTAGARLLQRFLTLGDDR